MNKVPSGEVLTSIRAGTNDAGLRSLIVDSIQDIKGKRIIELDLSRLDDAPADFFIICEGDSVTQMRAISANIYKRVKEEMGITPNHTEGMLESKWFLVDYFTTIVHIFYPESRSYYDLEGLWNDAEKVEMPEVDSWDSTSS